MTRATAAALALLLTACADTAAPDRERVMAGLLFYDDPVRVHLPDSAHAGQEFHLGIIAYILGECVEHPSADVTIEGLTAHITPWHDRVHRPGCTTTHDGLVYQIPLAFHDTGTATITLHGRHRPLDTPVTLHLPIPIH